MGHAGAIVSGESDTATAKMDAMEELGLAVVRNPAQIGETVARVVHETGAGLTRVAAR
jgi:succinyl-CoA synthetase alpha subunit